MQKINEIFKHITNYASEVDGVEVIWLAKGTSHNNSDIDIAIAIKNFKLTDIERKYLPCN